MRPQVVVGIMLAPLRAFYSVKYMWVTTLQFLIYKLTLTTSERSDFRDF